VGDGVCGLPLNDFAVNHYETIIVVGLTQGLASTLLCGMIVSWYQWLALGWIARWRQHTTATISCRFFTKAHDDIVYRNWNRPYTASEVTYMDDGLWQTDGQTDVHNDGRRSATVTALLIIHPSASSLSLRFLLFSQMNSHEVCQSTFSTALRVIIMVFSVPAVLCLKSSQVKFNNQLCGQSGRIAMWKWNKHISKNTVQIQL